LASITRPTVCTVSYIPNLLTGTPSEKWKKEERLFFTSMFKERERERERERMQSSQNKCGIILPFKLIVGNKSSTEQKMFTLT
jgi:hypothetical protein